MHRILVIYDDLESRRTVNHVLASAGYDVVAVPYFPAVIAEMLPPTKPDLVVLDMGSAGDRLQNLCRQLRKESKDVPLFVLGYGEPADRTCMLDLGADDYITKPLDATEFLARVRTRVKRWTSRSH